MPMLICIIFFTLKFPHKILCIWKLKLIKTDVFIEFDGLKYGIVFLYEIGKSLKSEIKFAIILKPI